MVDESPKGGLLHTQSSNLKSYLSRIELLTMKTNPYLYKTTLQSEFLPLVKKRKKEKKNEFLL